MSTRLQLLRPNSPALRTCAILAAVAAVACMLTLPAPAQSPSTPFVPDEYKFGRRQAGATLQYCLDTRDPDLPVARKIGEAIAQH
jgi:hypothetical protein